MPSTFSIFEWNRELSKRGRLLSPTAFRAVHGLSTFVDGATYESFASAHAVAERIREANVNRVRHGLDDGVKAGLVRLNPRRANGRRYNTWTLDLADLDPAITARISSRSRNTKGTESVPRQTHKRDGIRPTQQSTKGTESVPNRDEIRPTKGTESVPVSNNLSNHHLLPFAGANGAGANSSAVKPSTCKHKQRERILTEAQQRARKEFGDWWSTEWSACHAQLPYSFTPRDAKAMLDILRHSAINWELAIAKKAAQKYLSETRPYHSDDGQHRLPRFSENLVSYILSAKGSNQKGTSYAPNGSNIRKRPDGTREGEYPEPELMAAARAAVRRFS